MPVTLIDPFLDRVHKDEEFPRTWTETTNRFSNRPDLIGTHLHKNSRRDETLLYIDAMLWDIPTSAIDPAGRASPDVQHCPDSFQKVVTAKRTDHVG